MGPPLTALPQTTLLEMRAMEAATEGSTGLREGAPGEVDACEWWVYFYLFCLLDFGEREGGKGVMHLLALGLGGWEVYYRWDRWMDGILMMHGDRVYGLLVFAIATALGSCLDEKEERKTEYDLKVHK